MYVSLSTKPAKNDFLPKKCVEKKKKHKKNNSTNRNLLKRSESYLHNFIVAVVEHSHPFYFCISQQALKGVTGQDLFLAQPKAQFMTSLRWLTFKCRSCIIYHNWRSYHFFFHRLKMTRHLVTITLSNILFMLVFFDHVINDSVDWRKQWNMCISSSIADNYLSFLTLHQ